MIPIIFDSKATDFTTNGLGRLADTIRCTVTEERNGPYEMSLLYPVTGKHYSEITTSSIIVAKASPRAGLQAFRVFKVSRPISGRVTVSCRHVSYQMSYIPVRPFSASTLAGALAGLKSNALEPCPFTLTADFESAVSYATALPGAVRSWLGGREGSILDVYGGGEWEFNNWQAVLHRNRGADRGVVLRYGKNITDLTQETNIENTITGVLSYWQSEDVKVVLSSPVEAPTAANFPFPRTVVMDFSDKFENAPTEAALRAKTEAYVTQNRIGIPKVSITVTAVNLADALEFKGNAAVEDIGLCDTVTVDFVKLGVQEKAKIIRTEYDVLRERWNSFEVGEARTSLANTIEGQLQAISARPTYDQAQRSLDRATGVLNSGLRGHVIINRNAEGWSNEILFLDNENIAQARNVVRINNAGIGFSSTGYQGPYYQSWTIDGHLSLGGINNHFGDFMVLDENGIPTVEMDKSGLRLWRTKAIGYLSNGTMYADPDLTTPITPEEGGCYFDLVESAFYIWNGTEYAAPQGHEGLNARMTTDGLGIYNGEIDLKWNGETGLYFKAGEAEGESDVLQIGDFVVSKDYGRQVWQSSDEMTGMSGEPDNYGGYFMWAGWRGEGDFAMAVEDQGGGGADNVVIHGNLIVNDVNILDYIRSIEVKDDDDEDEGGGGSGGGGGGDSEYSGIEIVFDNNVSDGGDGPGSGGGSGGGGDGPSGPASDPDLTGGG